MQRVLLISCLISSFACGDDDCPPGTMASGGACVGGDDAGMEADGSPSCSEGETRSCGSEQGSCAGGTQACVAGLWGACAGETPASVETCNGIDDDCNGIVDDETTDSGGSCGDEIGACGGGVQSCVSGMLECVGGPEPTEEICNEIDDDCDAMTDEGVLVTFYADADGDGRGDPEVSMEACAAPSGFVATADDCDDACDVCWTGAAEVCDGFDNDCSGAADEGLTTTYYPDADGDGFGAPEGEELCEPALGYVMNSTDCDDDNGAVNPAQTRRFMTPRAGGSFDYNCDRVENYSFPRTTSSGPCRVISGACVGTGFTSAPPECGESGVRRVCVLAAFGAFCSSSETTVDQACL